MATNNHLYSDLDLRFKSIPSTGDVALRYDTQSVIASVRNLLSTRKYERPFQPLVESQLDNLLFEPVTSITATLIESEITRVLNNYEPRVIINTLRVTASIDQNSFNVSLSVFIGNATQPTAINLILQRTR
jgi:phage baseplate assembly protein W